MRDFYYFIKTLFYLFLSVVIIMLMTDYKNDRAKKQAVKTEIYNGLQQLIGN